MGHFHNPIIGPIVGATSPQPFGGTKKLPPSITAVPVNNPPFQYPAQTQAQEQLSAYNGQPAFVPWQYNYTGIDGQPYGRNKLNPSITAVPVNNPPFEYVGNDPVQIQLSAYNGQPDPWQFNELGAITGRQPYGARQLNPSITAVPVNNPPFQYPAQNQAQEQLSAYNRPPDPWQYLYTGSTTGLQPYGTKQLPPSITAVPVNNPPFSQRIEPLPGLNAWQIPDPPIQVPRYYPQAPVVVVVANVPFSQPWLSTVLSAWQPPDPLPTLQGKLNPFITAVPVNNPPAPPWQIPTWKTSKTLPILPNKLNPALLSPSVVTNVPFSQPWLSTILYSWLPADPLPTLQGKLNPSITAVPVNNPSPNADQLANLTGIIQSWQPPDPQPFVSYTGWQPLAPNKLSPGIPGQSADPPPFTQRNNNLGVLSTWWQPPDPLPLVSYTGGQPLAPGKLSPGIPGQSADPPPFSNPGRGPVANSVTQTWQPDPWTFNYVGWTLGLQPYGSRQLNPSITAVPVNNPPFNQRIEPLPGLQAWQIPDPPIQPPRYYPQAFVSVTVVPFSQPWLATVLASWQAPILPPTVPNLLNPSITAVPVNNPPFSQRIEPVPGLNAWQVPDPPIQLPRYYPQAPIVVVFVPFTNTWLSAVLTTWQPPDPLPTLPGLLNPTITGVPVNNPPFNQRIEPLPGLVVWQPPDPQPFISYTGWQPLAQNKLSPGIPGQSADPPPFTQRNNNLGVLGLWWQPPDPLPLVSYTGGQPLGPGKLSPGIPGQSADPPPFSNRGLGSTTASLIQTWQPDPWQYGELGAVTGLQPYGSKQLNPSITAVPVNNPPFSNVGKTLQQQTVVPITQPDPWQYVETGPGSGLQPYGNRLLNPSILSIRVDNPPFTNMARIEAFNTMTAAWEIPLPPQPQQTKYVVALIPPPPPAKDIHDHPFFATFGKMTVH